AANDAMLGRGGSVCCIACRGGKLRQVMIRGGAQASVPERCCSGDGTGELALTASAATGRALLDPREMRGRGEVHLDDGVDVPVLPGGGVLRGAAGAGEVAQPGALVAEDDGA